MHLLYHQFLLMSIFYDTKLSQLIIFLQFFITILAIFSTFIVNSPFKMKNVRWGFLECPFCFFCLFKSLISVRAHLNMVGRFVYRGWGGTSKIRTNQSKKTKAHSHPVNKKYKYVNYFYKFAIK